MFNKLVEFIAALFVTLALQPPVFAAETRRPAEWDKTLEEAKKEGKIVLAIPPATELRTALEPLLKQKFGLEAELVSAPGPKNASRIAAEKKAGVSYFDAIICGTGTAAGLTHDGMLEPMESFWILTGSERSEAVVGRPYLGRQRKHEQVSLFVSCRREHAQHLV